MKTSLFCFFALLLVTSPAYAQSTENSAPIKIGVVDLAVAFDKYKKCDELTKRMNRLGSDWRGEAAKLKSKIRRLVKERREAERGTEDYHTLDDLIVLEKARLRILEEQIEKRIKRTIARFRVEIFKDIEKAVSQCAKEQGLSLVFRTSSGRDSETYRSEHANQLKLLYFHKKLDITEDVIAILNKTPRKKKKAKLKKRY